MPFTVTHIAAAIPVAWLCRWRLPFSALAIGCAIPDIAAFYPDWIDYLATHSISGLLTHCLPIGVAFYYLYQSLLKRPLTDLLPRRLSQRLWPWLNKPIDFSIPAIILVFACVLFGAGTHVLWDSFTHGGRWGVQQFPVLKTTAFSLSDRSISWYSVLQHLSSLLFLPPMLLGFFIWIWRQPRDLDQARHFQLPRSVTWPAIGMMILTMGVHLVWARQRYPHDSLLGVTAHSIKQSGALMMIIVLLYCIAMHLIWAMQSDEEQSTTSET
ncbi:DUF4184 family protein [Novipirellula sp. SH528]|uniref:DUF4184 family protein n=1 Tax=Novipirellula sp. SH528 TaxID=3454466 RepID=UPI003FA14FA2